MWVSSVTWFESRQYGGFLIQLTKYLIYKCWSQISLLYCNLSKIFLHTKISISWQSTWQAEMIGTIEKLVSYLAFVQISGGLWPIYVRKMKVCLNHSASIWHRWWILIRICVLGHTFVCGMEESPPNNLFALCVGILLWEWNFSPEFYDSFDVCDMCHS